MFTAKGVPQVRVMTAHPMPSVAEPYIRLRAINHLEKGYLVIFAGGIGQPYVTTDYPAVQRALEIRADVILAAKNGVDGVYTADPRKHPDARRYKTADYDELLRTGAQVMDQSAFILAKEYGLPIYAFDFEAEDVMRRICQGEDVGTLIGPGLPTELA